MILKIKKAAIKITWFVREGEIWQKFEEKHTERAFSINKIEACLDYAGFSVVDKFGSLKNLTPLQSDSSRVWFLTRNDGSTH